MAPKTRTLSRAEEDGGRPVDLISRQVSPLKGGFLTVAHSEGSGFSAKPAVAIEMRD